MRAVQPVIESSQNGYSNSIVDNRFWSQNFFSQDTLAGLAMDYAFPVHNYASGVISPSGADTRAIPINQYCRITSAEFNYYQPGETYLGMMNNSRFAVKWFVMVAGTGTSTPRYVDYQEVYMKEFQKRYMVVAELKDLVLSPGDILYCHMMGIEYDRMSTFPINIESPSYNMSAALYGTLAPLGCYPPAAWS